MKDNLTMSGITHKFFFVGVLMAATMLVGHSSSFSGGAGEQEEAGASVTSSPPLFVLVTPPPPFAELSHDEKKTFNASTLLTAGIEPLVGSEDARGNVVPHGGSPYLTGDAPVSYANGALPSQTAPSPNARAALIADLESGETIFEFHAAQRWPLASLTKLMAAVVATNELEMDAIITIEQKDFVVPNSRVYFSLGDQVKASDLLRAMLIASSNEAAEALARSYGRADFIVHMNQQAQAWGLTETYFDDPTGISATNQSTPADLKVFATRLMGEYPALLSITQEPHAFIFEEASKTAHSIGSTNAFAGRGDFLGGKTGYTDEADGNLLSIFSYESRPVLIVVMGTAQRFQETEKLLAWLKQRKQ